MLITITDYHNLTGLLEMGLLKNKVSPVMEELQTNLKNARRVSQVKIPRNIVTMNSKVQLVEEITGNELIITLTYPHNADIANRKISVFTRQGAALLGGVEGDLVTWASLQYKIKKVLYQPEAEGHYHL